MKTKTKKLSMSVGITTCYGDISILDTVKSIRASKGLDKFEFIIIADRVPISKQIKKLLQKFQVRLIENKKESGLIEKQKQILSMVKTDITIFIQDDVLLDSNTLSTVIKRFTDHQKTTMISIPYIPVKSQSFFESVINVGTNIANKTAKNWNRGDNYLSVIGRFMAFRTQTLKKFRLPNISTADSFYYFENKQNNGVFEYIPDVAVYFRNPQNMKEHLRKSSRFQFSQLELSRYFKDISQKYRIPRQAIFKSVLDEFFENPINLAFYCGVYLYTRILKMKPQSVLNTLWEVDDSTKKVFIK